MRAIVLTEIGSPDNLELRELPDPVAGPGELLIAVEAASIAPVDRGAVETGLRRQDARPGALDPRLGPRRHGARRRRRRRGRAGRAPRARASRSGSRAAPARRRRWWCCPRDNVAVVGDAIPSAELTTFGLNGLTALQVLDAAELDRGHRSCSSGASGSVGGFVAQLAEHRGITVLPPGATPRRPTSRAWSSTG